MGLLHKIGQVLIELDSENKPRGNALWQAIPPHNMPTRTTLEMTAKGSMTTNIFIRWLDILVNIN